LFERLGRAGRITQVSAPAGSGKTFLLRSWIGAAALTESTAWVPVHREERNPQRFWVSVLSALQQTVAGSTVVRPLTAAPDLDGWAVVERLLKDLESLPDRAWLVIDDAHELRSAETLSQLELLLMRAPPELRCVLATRHDMRLGLHRLRLEGELTEIRAANLRFTLDEARALFGGAGVELPESALALLHTRTEGWAAGLRLAALSLAGHPDPERFAAEFSGSERTVAEYLLAEVMERQSEEVRRLLLRTSMLDRISGELADLLTGGSGGERILQDLEEAGAFVVSLDGRRSWFRYHRLFADLLQLELRHTEPGELPALHATAAGWYAGHGYPAEAVRHAQAARDWSLAARLLSDHWVDLDLGGQAATARELLAAFPAGVAAADAELTALTAAAELARGSLEEAERQLALAVQRAASVPADRRGRFEVMLTVLQLHLARQRGDVPAVAEAAGRLLAAVEASEEPQLGLGEDLRALALISLGIAEVWALRFKDADQHLEQGVTLAHRIGRPYLEVTGLAHGSELAALRSGRRSTWPDSTAGATSRSSPWPTRCSAARWSPRDSWERLSAGSDMPRALFNRPSNRPSGCISITLTGASKWPAVVTPTRSRPSGPHGSWPRRWSPRIPSPPRCGRICWSPSSCWAKRFRSNVPWRSWTRVSARAARCATSSHWSGWPSTIRRARRQRSRPSWMAPSDPIRYG
jgi:LuxR family maltose regulon positive regulatory protein